MLNCSCLLLGVACMWRYSTEGSFHQLTASRLKIKQGRPTVTSMVSTFFSPISPNPSQFLPLRRCLKRMMMSSDHPLLKLGRGSTSLGKSHLVARKRREGFTCFFAQCIDSFLFLPNFYILIYLCNKIYSLCDSSNSKMWICCQDREVALT